MFGHANVQGSSGFDDGKFDSRDDGYLLLRICQEEMLFSGHLVSKSLQ